CSFSPSTGHRPVVCCATVLFFLSLRSHCSRFCRRPKRSRQHPTEAIPTTTPQKATVPFSALPAARTTQLLALTRFSGTQELPSPATVRPPPAVTTRQSVLMRSLATQPAARTRPTVLMRSLATQP